MCAERYSRAFTNNKTERLAAGDPRLSIAERYRDHRDYMRAVTRAAKKLVKEGFLLKKDDDRIIDRAERDGVICGWRFPKKTIRNWLGIFLPGPPDPKENSPVVP